MQANPNKSLIQNAEGVKTTYQRSDDQIDSIKIKQHGTINLRYSENINERKEFPDCISKSVAEILRKEKIIKLFPPQADTIELALNKEGNFLINLPTSCGKTMIAEVIMVESILKNKKKALYLAPYKALAKEKAIGLKDRWGELGLNIVQLTGGQSVSDQTLHSADIIILTNEKADIIFRNKKREALFQSIGLIICDEIHLLGEGNRGMTLEVLLTRFLFSMRKHLLNCRIIGLSATVGNPTDLAHWLKATLIRSEWRPVVLQEFIYCNGKTFGKQYDPQKHEVHKQLISNRKDDLLRLAKNIFQSNSQALVFMNTRAETELIKTHLIKEGVNNGVDFHHAGLDDKEKNERETKFKKGEIKILLSTTTLAAGINLPATYVIIYNPTMPGLSDEEYISVISYNQMAGRAGRIGLADKGVCFILAENSKQIEEFHKRYLKGTPENILSEFDLTKNEINQEQLKYAAYSITPNPIINLQKHLLGFFILPEINTISKVMEFMEDSYYFSYQNSDQIRKEFEGYVLSSIEMLEKKFGMLNRKENDELILSLLGFLTVRMYIYPVSAYWIRLRFKSLYESSQKLSEFDLGKKESKDIVYLLYSLINLPDSSTRVGTSNDLEKCYPIKAILEQSGNLTLADQQILGHFGLLSHDANIRSRCIGNLKAISVLIDRMNGKETPDILEEYEYGITDYTDLWMKFSELMRKLDSIISFSGYYSYKTIEGLKSLLKYIGLKIMYNVDDKLLDLCQIEEIGKATAEKLYKLGIKNAEDVVNANDQNIMKIRGIGEKKMIKIKVAAIRFLMEQTESNRFENNTDRANLESSLRKYTKLLSQFGITEKSIYESIN